VAKEANEPGEKRRRSPSVPFIALDKAFGRASDLHDRAGRNRFRIADAASVWGLRAKSSATSQTVAALYAYGLVEVAGRSGARQIRLREPVARLFEDPSLSPEAKQQIITQAALKPKLIAHYAGEWRADRPGDAVCIAELKAVHGFTEAAAARFLQVFDNAMQSVAGRFTGVGPENNQESVVAMAPGNGDTAGQNRGALHIIQRDRRLEIKADMGLEELRQLAEVLLHYRAILALPLPQSAEALGPELGTSRGIAFPLIGLRVARDTASWLYSYAKREAVLIANVVSAVDQDPKGVSMLQELEALVHFGLAEQSGSGKGRKIRVTDLALRVIEFTNAQIREQGAREAAGRPKLIAHYAALWPDGRPEDVGLHRAVG